MKNSLIKFIGLLLVSILLQGVAQAAPRQATIRINSKVTHQKITGFGGFVNSPSFGYNHMTEAEIRKLWGKDSETGYNIMRLYIPTGENNWNQCVATAQLAKQLGLFVFASPWSMPAQWKAYNTVNAVYNDNGTKRDNYLKEEYYADYADYLNNFVTFLRDRGVELDAISIQNEPDERAEYSGCIWTPAQIAKFLKENRSRINCKVIAPEPVGLKDDYADALLPDNMLDYFDIFGGHQYMSPQSHHKQFHAKGKEVWMTEYLISWADGSRNVDWAQDAFNFAGKINLCMTEDVNAWVHYAAKRYYGLMGDNLNGTTTGEITKRGYILSHYAKYTTGTTRIENTWSDNSNQLQGSSYLSVTGDSVIVMVINPSADSYTFTVDLPFFTESGKSITTTQSLNMSESDLGLSGETCRPKVNIAASSVTTLIFTRSRERTESQMKGEAVHYFKIEDQTVTNAAFGNNYQLSGKKVTFRSSTPLISSNTTATNGYLALKDPYNQLVFHVNKISSSGSLVSGNTTLYYINNNGEVKSHKYLGDGGNDNISFSKTTDFDWVFDISRQVLTDGCKGIVGITCSNYSSVLELTLGDVFFRMGNERMFKFKGDYNESDGYLLDCLEDATFTSLDFTETNGITAGLNWSESAANKNCIYLVDGNIANNNTNVISGTACNILKLTDEGGDFYAPFNFTANAASCTRTVNGYEMLVLPFEASIPAGLKVYTATPSATNITCTQISGSTIPANVPVLIEGSGTFTFEGSGTVSSPLSQTVNDMTGVYISVKAPAGSYYLKTVDGVAAFHKITKGSEPAILPFSAYLATALATETPLPLNIIADNVPPTPGNSGIITTANIAYNSLTLNWTAATDNVTQAANLKYCVYQSSSDNISTIEGCANGTLLNAGGTANITTYSVAGLSPGTVYYFNVVAEDEAGNRTAYVMQSETTATPTYGVNIGSLSGGSITTDKATVTEGETVTLTITPAAGYELNTILVHKDDDINTEIPLSGSGNTRTFEMPAYTVTVTATFGYTADQQAVLDAKDLIEGMTGISVAQATANTEETVKAWLAAQINALQGMSVTGITIQASDITVGSGNFMAAANGTNGSFLFTVSLQKGNSTTVTTAGVSGTITATPIVNAQIPVISGQPQDATVNVAESITLSVTASVTDGGTLSYQWYENTVNSNTGGTAISGATEAGYTVPSTVYGTVYYYVLVTNTNNSVNGTKTASATSRTATVNVNVLVNAAIPDISDHPQDATVNVDENISLWVSASVTDGGTLSYQWYKNTVNSNTGGTAISGATRDTYSPSTSSEGTAYYCVVVTNTNNSVNGSKTATTISNTATVTVNIPIPTYPVTIAAMTNGTVTASPSNAQAGETVRLTIKPAAGYELDKITTTPSVEIVYLTSQYTFTMPASSVTVNVTFKKTQAQLNKEAVEAAKAAIEGGTYLIAQARANNKASVEAWLANTLTTLFGQSHSILFRAAQPSIVGDVTVATVTPAVAGTKTSPDGTHGSFFFSVVLRCGETTLTTTTVAGTIVATPYISGTGISEVSQGKPLQAWIQNGTLHVSGLTAGKLWQVYSISGTLVYSHIASGNEANVNLPGRSVYIITSGNDVAKVVY